MRYEIEVYKDYVIVFGKRVDRPSRLSCSQWIEFWEARKG